MTLTLVHNANADSVEAAAERIFNEHNYEIKAAAGRGLFRITHKNSDVKIATLTRAEIISIAPTIAQTYDTYYEECRGKAFNFSLIRQRLDHLLTECEERR